MKIKIIDLLNMIADCKKLPKKFMCKGHLYYMQKTKGICYRCDELNEIFEECLVLEDLNDTIEIIEESKKILGKLDWNKNDFTYLEGNLMSEETADMLMEIQDKINNIIDILDKGE